jgi:hypothetical protein
MTRGAPAENAGVEIEFDPRCADYVREREWHRSQEIVEGEGGAIVLRLCVSDDRALRAWVLSFVASARVPAPVRLAKEIGGELQVATERYAPRMKFEMLRVMPSMSASTRSRSRPTGKVEAAG